MRFHVLDGWRGVCALLVALFHVNAVGHFYGLPVVRNGLLFVDFFFVLSGFVITHAYAERVSAGGVRDFIVRRIGRLWPLHMVLLAAFIALELVKLALETRGIGYGREPFTRDADPLAIVTNVLMIHDWGIHRYLTWNNPSWSISAEWAAYLTFAAVYTLAPRRAGLFAAAIALVSLGLLAFVAPNGMTSTYDYGVARCGLGFGIGHLVYRLFRASRPLPLPTAFEVGSVAVAALVVSLSAASPLAFTAPFAFGAVVYVFAFQGGAVSRLMGGLVGRKLGEWSYSIYMVQGLMFSVLTPALALAWPRLGWGEAVRREGDKVLLAFSPMWSDVYALACLAVLVGCSAITYRLIEVPGRDLFARLAAARPAPEPVTVADERV